MRASRFRVLAALALLAALLLAPFAGSIPAQPARAGVSGPAHIVLTLKQCSEYGLVAGGFVSFDRPDCTEQIPFSASILFGNVSLSSGQFLNPDGSSTGSATVSYTQLFSELVKVLDLYVAPGPVTLTLDTNSVFQTSDVASVAINPTTGGTIRLTGSNVRLIENEAPRFSNVETDISTTTGIAVSRTFDFRDDDFANPPALSLTDMPDHGTLDLTVLFGAVATYTYTPAEGFVGTDTFTFRLTDRAPAPYTLTASATITVTVLPDSPTVTGLEGRITTTEDTPVTVPFTVADAVTAPAALTVTATDPARGSVTLGGAGSARSLTYTPDPNANGSDSFEVTVSNGSSSTVVPVAVTITAVNDPPVIDEMSVPAGQTIEATGPGGATAIYTAPTAIDPDIGGTVTVACLPASGATFPIGTTTVTCTATDTGGLTDEATFTVTVEDTTAPTLTVSANITVEATSPSGATVTFTATATDLVDGAVTPVCTPASGSVFPVGTTTVSCTATDAAGNTSVPQAFAITVRDTTGPAITWVGGPQPNRSYTQATLPTEPTCTAIDAASVVTQCRVYGYSTAPGTHTLTARARDSVGNSSISTRTYTVTASAPTATPRPPTVTPRPTSVPPTATPTRPTRPTATTAPVQPTATPVTPVVPPTGTPTRPPRR